MNKNNTTLKNRIIETYELMDEIGKAYERSRLLIDSTPLACRLWNRDAEIFDCNEESLRLFKVNNRKEFVEKYFELSPEFQPDGSRSKEKAMEYLKKAFDDGKVVCEWLHQTLDGEPIPTEITLVRVPYENDYVVAGYTRDMREHNRMMEEIKHRDNLLSTGSRAAETLLSSSERGADIEVLLMKSMEIVGRSIEADRVQIWRNEIINGELHFVHTYQWLSHVGLEKPEVPIGLEFTYQDTPEWEYRVQHGAVVNGPFSELPLDDREFLAGYDIKSIVIIPLFLREQFWGFFSIDDCVRERTFTEDEMSTLRSISLMMANAVDRHTQATELNEAYEQTRQLVDTTPFACHLWSRDFKLIDCNVENKRLFNLKNKQEFINDFFKYMPEYQPDGQSSKELACGAIQKAYDKGRFVVEDCMHLTSGGAPLPAEVTLVRVPFKNDYIVAAYLRDLREQKETSLKLKEALNDAKRANNAKSDFLANMSHEMRTPLNAIIGLSGLSLDNDGLNEDSRSNLEKIYNAGTTLLSTVNDILDISKIEAGKMELIPIDYEIPSIINDTVTQNVLRIGEKPIKLKLDIDETMLTYLNGDELRVKQIINNLLSNAIKYTREGAVTLSVCCKREASQVWLNIKVSDTGIGIRKEDIEKLFYDYTQIDTKVTRKIEGTGLGLPITKKLTEMMEGEIFVESEYGKGSVFTIKIKQNFVSDTRIGMEVAQSLKAFRYSDNRRDKNAKLTRIKLPNARVLIVDDIQTNLDVAKSIMKPYGMQIDTATSGAEAFFAINNPDVKYDAIFMDQMMPSMDGFEATRMIREIGSDYAKNIPVIALTANAIIGNEEKFLNAGFQAFLTKPIDMNRLDEIIRLCIGKNGQQSVTVSKNPESDVNRQLSALDFKKGVAGFGGDEGTYINVLRSFASNTRPLLEKITNVKQAQLSDYATTVHGIKGSSRGIHADALGIMAEALEKAAKNGDFKYVKLNNHDFINTARRLIDELDTFISGFNNENAKPLKEKPDNELLLKLREACEVYSMDKVDEVMDELEKYKYKSDELITWLRDNVNAMNFEEIIKRIG